MVQPARGWHSSSQHLGTPPAGLTALRQLLTQQLQAPPKYWAQYWGRLRAAEDSRWPPPCCTKCAGQAACQPGPPLRPSVLPSIHPSSDGPAGLRQSQPCSPGQGSRLQPRRKDVPMVGGKTPKVWGAYRCAPSLPSPPTHLPLELFQVFINQDLCLPPLCRVPHHIHLRGCTECPRQPCPRIRVFSSSQSPRFPNPHHPPKLSCSGLQSWGGAAGGPQGFWISTWNLPGRESPTLAGGEAAGTPKLSSCPVATASSGLKGVKARPPDLHPGAPGGGEGPMRGAGPAVTEAPPTTLGPGQRMGGWVGWMDGSVVCGWMDE